jgi:hypothetical protein
MKRNSMFSKILENRRLTMKFSRTLTAAAALLASSAAMAEFWGSNRYDGYGGDYNDWPVWTPMYWMEEFFDNGFGNNNDGYGPYGYGAPYGYTPYSGYAPYGAYPGYGYAPYPAPIAPQGQ